MLGQTKYQLTELTLVLPFGYNFAHTEDGVGAFMTRSKWLNKFKFHTVFFTGLSWQ